MKTVRQLLQAKGDTVYSIAPDARVYEALKLMAEKEVGALVVLAGGALAGILSERDYARKVILHGKSSHDIPVREIMTANVVTVNPGQTVDQCMALMTNNRIRHLTAATPSSEPAGASFVMRSSAATTCLLNSATCASKSLPNSACVAAARS